MHRIALRSRYSARTHIETHSKHFSAFEHIHTLSFKTQNESNKRNMAHRVALFFRSTFDFSIVSTTNSLLIYMCFIFFIFDYWYLLSTFFKEKLHGTSPRQGHQRIRIHCIAWIRHRPLTIHSTGWLSRREKYRNLWAWVDWIHIFLNWNRVVWPIKQKKRLTPEFYLKKEHRLWENENGQEKSKSVIINGDCSYHELCFSTFKSFLIFVLKWNVFSYDFSQAISYFHRILKSEPSSLCFVVHTLIQTNFNCMRQKPTRNVFCGHEMSISFKSFIFICSFTFFLCCMPLK